MERYEAYKDSGVEWIGEIPKGWTTARLGEIAYIRARLGWRALKAEEYVLEGYPMYSAFNIVEEKFVPEPVNYITEFRFLESPEIMMQIGDIMLVKDGAGVGKCAVIRELDGPGTVNGSIALITPDLEQDSRYIYYFFESNAFQHFSKMLMGGMGVPHLFQRDIKLMRVVQPDARTQSTIADYLDEKTAEIDALVADCEREVELLGEYRKAVISEAVTKGLDPDAPMKNSGIEWIGEIPEGWNRGRIAWLRSLPTSYGIIKLGDVPDTDGVPTLRCSDVKEGKLILASVRTVYPELSDEYSRTVLNGGEIVINVRGTLGGCAVVPGECKGWNIAREVARIDVRPEFDSRFVMYFLLSNQFWSYLNANLAGSVYQGLNIELLEHAEIVFPNAKQQMAIAEYLDAMSAEIDSLIEAKQSMADKLREYRRSLISEAVTGKFKVPGV